MAADRARKENEALIRRFYAEVVNGRDMQVLDEIVAPDFVDHNAPREFSGIAGFKQFLSMLATAFPDIQVSVEDLIVEGSKVAARVQVKGTHQGLLLGTIAPTGKAATWSGIDLFSVDSGIITKRWSERDLLGLMRQLEES